MGNAVHLSRLVRQYADHLMHGEVSRRRLEHQIAGRQAQVVDRGPIVPAIAPEFQAHYTQREDGRPFRPCLVSVDQTAEQTLELLWILLSVRPKRS